MALGIYIYPAVETSHRGSWGHPIHGDARGMISTSATVSVSVTLGVFVLDVSNSRAVDSDGWGSARDNRDSRTVSQVR